MPQKTGEVEEMLPKLYARLQAEAVLMGPPGWASDCVQGALAAMAEYVIAQADT